MEHFVGTYGRVSSPQQTEAGTIDSQRVALRDRVAADGFRLSPEYEFMDDGYSGATLIRPALERLRDCAATGALERLYVHSPDRLARSYAHQVLLLDEFTQLGVAVIFLNREIGQTPEDTLLLQVQGMVAEYERAKILERSRRGKRHAAQKGVVSVLGGAPYGYRYICRADGDGAARYEIDEAEARVVRQIFVWVGQDRLSIGDVQRRLTTAQERTRTGKTIWDRSVVWGMLKNPAYTGQAAFGKTQTGAMNPRLRQQRNQRPTPKRPKAVHDVPREEWLSVRVPALVDETLFTAVQEQLAENRHRARQGQRGVRYLLQGLLVCTHCGYAYYGKQLSPSARKQHPRAYAYYRCIGSDGYRFGGERICPNTQVRTDKLELAVWHEVCTLLLEPQRLEQEYQHRRLARETPDETAPTASHIAKLRQVLERLIDGYADGVIARSEFEPRVQRVRERLAQYEEQVQQLRESAKADVAFGTIMQSLTDFAGTVRDSLDHVDWLKQREIIRVMVKRVEIGTEAVTVVFRVVPDATDPDPGQSMQHCWRRNRCTFWQNHGQPKVYWREPSKPCFKIPSELFDVHSGYLVYHTTHQRRLARICRHKKPAAPSIGSGTIRIAVGQRSAPRSRPQQRRNHRLNFRLTCATARRVCRTPGLYIMSNSAAREKSRPGVRH